MPVDDGGERAVGRAALSDFLTVELTMASERLRAMLEDAPEAPRSVMDKFRIACALHRTGVELMRQNLRRSHPQASAEEISELLVAWLLRGHP